VDECKPLPCGTHCWTDDFIRKACKIPTLLPQLQSMLKLMNNLLLPLTALAHCDAVKNDPSKYVAATEGWVNMLRQILSKGDDAVLEFFENGFTKEQRVNMAAKAGLVVPVAEGDDDSPQKVLKKLQKKIAGELKIHGKAVDARALELRTAAGGQEVDDRDGTAAQQAEDRRVAGGSPQPAALSADSTGMTAAEARAAVGEAHPQREDRARADAAPDVVYTISPELLAKMTKLHAYAAIRSVISAFSAHPALIDVSGGRVRVTSVQLTAAERVALMVAHMHCRKVEKSFAILGHVSGRTNNGDTRSSTLLARVRGAMHIEVYPWLTLEYMAARWPELVAQIRAEATLWWAPVQAGGGQVSYVRKREELQTVQAFKHLKLTEKADALKEVMAKLDGVVEAINTVRQDPEHQIQLKEKPINVDVTQTATVQNILKAELSYFLAIGTAGGFKNKNPRAKPCSGEMLKAELMGMRCRRRGRCLSRTWWAPSPTRTTTTT